MAKADTSVKWFHSQMADAPILNGTTGSGIGVLDACLLNGFSVRTPDSVVVSSGVATVSIGSGNPYEKHAVIKISGASEPALNGEWRIDSHSAVGFTFLCPGVADGIVTGSTVVRASAGWLKPFSGTNTAVYQSSKIDSTKLFLQVREATYLLYVRGYEYMTDFNAGTGEFPLFTTVSDNNFIWRKSLDTTSTARRWIIASDGYFTHVIFYTWADSSTYSGGLTFGFGDIVSFAPNDAYNFLLIGTSGVPSTPAVGNLPGAQPYSGATGRYFARQANQITNAPSSYGMSAQTHTTGDGSPSFDGVVRYFPVFQLDTSSQYSVTRGKIPALFTSKEPSNTLRDVQVSEENGSVILEFSPAYTSRANRQAAIDIVGPWR